MSHESYITTDGQSASLSWNKAPIWGLRPDFYYCQTVADLLVWDALSDQRTGLTFTIAAGPRQRSYSRVRVSWNARPYFTVSDLKLPFLSPPTTCRATMEVFDPASTREANEVSYITSRRPEYRSPSQMVPLLFCVIRCHGNLYLWYYSLPRKRVSIRGNALTFTSVSVATGICMYRTIA
jgi:hypothetical protein